MPNNINISLERAVSLLKAQVLFHRIQIKPGGPAMSFKKNGKIILCLSGNPFAAAATFELLAVPVLGKLSGLCEHLPKRVTGILCSPFHKTSGGRRFIRAKMLGMNVFFPESGHESGKLFSFHGCNCMVDIAVGSPPLEPGEKVEVVLL